MNSPPAESNDPFELSRFVEAQQDSFELALSEVKHGQKRSHWMWFIYPQLRGLGQSSMAERFGITGLVEAHAYLAHGVLGPRLVTMCDAVLAVEGRSATQIFGSPDNKKLHSCATLFAHISIADSVFHQIIAKYFDGESDPQTLQLLSR